jgi:hypothetical protein
MDILRSVIHVTLIHIKFIYERKFVRHVTVNITQHEGLCYTIVPDLSKAVVNETVELYST